MNKIVGLISFILFFGMISFIYIQSGSQLSNSEINMPISETEIIGDEVESEQLLQEIVADLMRQFSVDREIAEEAIWISNRNGVSPEEYLRQRADVIAEMEADLEREDLARILAMQREVLIHDLIEEFSVDRATAEEAIEQSEQTNQSPEQILQSRAGRP